MHLQILGRLTHSRRLRAAFGLWLVAALTLGAPWLDAATYYVDDTIGLDSRTPAAAQTVGTPWKTITHALSQATSGDTINVAPGTYDTANGETFPLGMKSGVAVIGAGSGSVTSVNVTNGGSGYTDGTFAVSFVGGGGAGADGFAVVSGGVVTDVIVTAGGGGYSSAPTVDLTGAPTGSGAAATATVGAGTSTVSAPEGAPNSAPVFSASTSLNVSTRVSGFLVKHDTAATASSRGFSFAVGAGVTQSPRIDHNAFIDQSDIAVFFYDDSTSAGTFTPTIDHNTVSSLYEGIWGRLSNGTAQGGADHYGGTVSNNTFSNVEYPFNYSFSSANGGTIDTVFDSNQTYHAIDDVYDYGSMGQDLATFAPTFSNNTFIDASDEGVYSSITFYSGAHTYEPVFRNNTITAPANEAMSINLSVSSSTGAGAQTLRPTIDGNTMTDSGYGVDLTLDNVEVPNGTNVEFSPVITNNTITNMSSYGIMVSLSSMSDGDFLSNMTISGNHITDASTGLYVELSEFYDSAIDSYQADWNISNNTITGPSGEGITLSISSLTGPQSGHHNVVLAGNTIDGGGGNGVEIDFSPGTAAVIDSSWTVSGNTITNNAQAGLYLTFSEMGHGAADLLAKGNTITGNGTDGINVSLETMTDVASDDIRFASNYIEGNAGYGIRVQDLEGVPQQAIFSCNTITNNGGGGVYVHTANVETGAGTNLAVNFGDSTAGSPGDNQIYGNTPYDFDNHSTITAKAENNWWGTANAATVVTHVSGPVDYQPLLSAPIVTSATAALVPSLLNDADASGTPTVGDTLRFCTTITAGANCGPSTITLSVPLPGNVSLVPGSVTTGGNGGYDPAQPDVTVTGIALNGGQSADICFDVVVNGGTVVALTATATAANMTDAVDTATVTLGAVAAIPTLGEWARLFIPLLLLAVGVIVSRRRRSTIVLMLAAAFLVVAPFQLQAASPGKGPKIQNIENEAVTVAAVTTTDNTVTVTLADGRAFTVDEHHLSVKDKRISHAEKRAEHQASRSARISATASESREPREKARHDDKFSAQMLASLVRPGVATSASAGHRNGQPAILKVRFDGDKVRRLTIALYASDDEARDVVRRHAQAKAEAKSRETAQSAKETAPPKQ